MKDVLDIIIIQAIDSKRTCHVIAKLWIIENNIHITFDGSITYVSKIAGFSAILKEKGITYDNFGEFKCDKKYKDCLNLKSMDDNILVTSNMYILYEKINEILNPEIYGEEYDMQRIRQLQYLNLRRVFSNIGDNILEEGYYNMANDVYNCDITIGGDILNIVDTLKHRLKTSVLINMGLLTCLFFILFFIK